jgi:glucose-1-phosphate cytidylyltransferase
MKTVILCGGKGTRLSEETKKIPKPMVKVGKLPIIEHIINIYIKFGIKDFIFALGYKKEIIKKYFSQKKFKNLNIQFVDTGLNTLTGKRLKKLEKFLKDEKHFFVTYGDGLADIDINKLIKFHFKNNKVATVTAVRPPARFGELLIDKNKVKKFYEKNQIRSGWINGGFFVFKNDIFKYLSKKDCMLEKYPMLKLVKHKQLVAYQHHSFWQCMDTLRDKELLNKIWKKNKSKW